MQISIHVCGLVYGFLAGGFVWGGRNTVARGGGKLHEDIHHCFVLVVMVDVAATKARCDTYDVLRNGNFCPSLQGRECVLDKSRGYPQCGTIVKKGRCQWYIYMCVCSCFLLSHPTSEAFVGVGPAVTWRDLCTEVLYVCAPGPAGYDGAQEMDPWTAGAL